MKTLLSLSFAVAALLALGAKVHSQAPAAARSPVQVLQAMKARNQELIEKQTQTLIQLEAMQKEAEQIRILARRT